MFRGILTDEPHPTREEWESRKGALPEPARALLAQLAERKSHETREREIQARREEAEAADWRAEFESRLAALLVEIDAAWLVAYRVPDRLVIEQGAFRATTEDYFAVFDGTGFGLWPIRVRLVAGTGHARQWRPADPAFQVARPAGVHSYRAFHMALAVAASYCPTPF